MRPSLPCAVQAWRIRRQLQHAHPKAAPAAPDSSRGKGTSAGSMTPMPSSARLALPAESEEVRMEAGALPLPESPLGPGRLCARCLPTGQLVLNSSPVPDMLPSEGAGRWGWGCLGGACPFSAPPVPARLCALRPARPTCGRLLHAGWAHQKSFMKRTLSVELLAEAAPAPKTPKTPRGAHAAARCAARRRLPGGSPALGHANPRFARSSDCGRSSLDEQCANRSPTLPADPAAAPWQQCWTRAAPACTTMHRG